MAGVLKRPAESLGAVRLHGRPIVASRPMAYPASVPSQAMPSPGGQPAPDAAQLRAELAALRETAVREGRAQGEQEARRAMELEGRRWREGLASIEAAVSRRLAELEPLSVAIAYEALATLLGKAYADGTGVVATVRELLAAAQGRADIVVRLHPAQLERARASLEGTNGGAGQRLRFEADSSMEVSECRVVSELGVWEGGLQVQLQAVQDALLHAHAAGSRA